MSKQIYMPIVRMGVSVSQLEIDQKEETEQGKAHSVRELFEDYVLGRLDPSQIGGNPSYDPEGSEEVDPFNSFGMTFEQASSIHDDAKAAYMENKQRKKTVANAPADKQQQVDGQKKEHSSESADEGQVKA